MRKMPQQKPSESKQSYGTPPEFLTAALRRLAVDHFAWDLACDSTNCVSPFGGYTLETDGLALENGWNFPGWCFLNPEWADIGPWVEKAAAEAAKGAHIAVLVPASVGANWWVAHVDGKARVLMLNGRITFVGMTLGYPKDCVLLLYGPDQIPGYEPWTWMDLLTDEEKIMAKKRVGKGPNKRKAAKQPKVRAITEGRRKRGRPAKSETASSAPAGRVTTFKPNGPTSTEPAPERDLGLGPILLPNPEDAVIVLKELAELNDSALKAEARYTELRDLTKTAKEKFDEAAKRVLTRLRQTTHKSELPLFDVQKAEEAQGAMEAAGASETGDLPPETVPGEIPVLADVVDGLPPLQPETVSQEPGTGEPAPDSIF